MRHRDSAEDYLEAILMIEELKGYARSVDVAKQLGFSKPSVSTAVGKLEVRGLVEKKEDGSLRLTISGREIAEKTLEKHRFFSTLFTRLGVAPDIAEADACAVEHSISDVTYQALRGRFSRQD